jgi:hypothetical protein
LRNLQHDDRVYHLDMAWGNLGMQFGYNDLWGNDPSLLGRYAQFITFTQGQDPDRAIQAISLLNGDPFLGLYQMLRCRYIFTNDPAQLVIPLPQAMQHVQLISNYAVAPGQNKTQQRDWMFRQMMNPAFDPRQMVLLTENPVPQPEPSSATTIQGTASLLKASPDELEIRAELTKPAILLVTDAYSIGWHVRAIDKGPQDEYRILPANHILRAVPLAAGRHHIMMEYRAPGLPAGAWIIILTLLAWVIGLLKTIKQSNHRHLNIAHHAIVSDLRSGIA